MIYEYGSTVDILTGKTEELGEESDPEPLNTYPTWIDQDLIGDRLAGN